MVWYWNILAWSHHIWQLGTIFFSLLYKHACFDAMDYIENKIKISHLLPKGRKETHAHTKSVVSYWNIFTLTANLHFRFPFLLGSLQLQPSTHWSPEFALVRCEDFAGYVCGQRPEGASHSEGPRAPPCPRKPPIPATKSILTARRRQELDYPTQTFTAICIFLLTHSWPAAQTYTIYTYIGMLQNTNNTLSKHVKRLSFHHI